MDDFATGIYSGYFPAILVEVFSNYLCGNFMGFIGYISFPFLKIHKLFFNNSYKNVLADCM